MRIAMMTDVYKPHISGVTNYISLNKEYLEKAGHEVFIFTFGDMDHKDDDERVVRSPGFPLTDSGYYLSFRYSRRAKALLQTMDLVHVHHPFLSGRFSLITPGMTFTRRLICRSCPQRSAILSCTRTCPSFARQWTS
jgi:glycosyltransferase involved in cell wall biosynthesis